MEMQFDRIPIAYLQKIAGQLRSQEQTLELRLPDGMPDIGRVLGAWGQMIVRSKEWNGDTMAVSCGVMVWVLYTPEEGGGARSVEAWLPFTVKWELPDSRYDGKILASCLLKGVDARSTSARKLMIRANMGAFAEAWVQGQGQMAVPAALPEDVELLTAAYPLLLPKEAGEKTFLIEEQMPLPEDKPPVEKLLYYSLQPQISDKKVMGDKVVFRGNALLHLLCRAEDGSLFSWDYEIPFSQYGELEGQYDQNPTVTVQPCVTSLDVSADENGQLTVKAGLLGQFLVCEQTVVTVAEDAYSPHRQVEPLCEELYLPGVLDQTEQTIHAEKTAEAETDRLVDVAFYPQMGQMETAEQETRVPLQGQFQLLYYDPEGELAGLQSLWEGQWSQNAAEDTRTTLWLSPTGKPEGLPGVGTVEMYGDMTAEAVTLSGRGISMVTGLELGELQKPGTDRPSLILCRKGDKRLWDVAKENGSTVQTILRANGLDTEPENDKILLIPVV